MTGVDQLREWCDAKFVYFTQAFISHFGRGIIIHIDNVSIQTISPQLIVNISNLEIIFCDFLAEYYLAL